MLLLLCVVVTDMSQEEQNEDLQELPRWLLDAPHFIDDKRINSFYDAVIRPKAKIEESITITVQKEDVKEIKKEFGIGIEIQPPDIVNMVTPFLRAGGGQTGSYTRFGRRKNEIRLNEINTPQRQLIQLLLQYFIKHPDRIASCKIGYHKMAGMSIPNRYGNHRSN